MIIIVGLMTTKFLTYGCGLFHQMDKIESVSNIMTKKVM